MGYKLFTDSTNDLPASVLKEYDITVVPLSVLFDDKEYLDLTSSQFYDMLAKADTLPRTSQVPPERFQEAFKKVLDQGDKIICVTIGANASGTYQSACIAKEALETEDIIVIDSNSLCLGTGMIVYKIAQMLRRGDSIEDIMAMVDNHNRNQIEHLFCVDTLKYLRKGGRIKASKAIIAEILNIKPILNVDNAITQPLSKVRGKNKIISAFIEHMKNNFDYDKNDVVLVGHSLDPEFADKLILAIKQELRYNGEFIVGEIGPTIGVHAGPGVLSVFYLKK